MSTPSLNRRSWLRNFVVTTGAVAVAPLASWAAETPAGERVRLVADPARDLFRVRVEMEIDGNIHVPRNALVSQEAAAQVPVKSKALLDWEERLQGRGDDGTCQAAARYYFEGSSSGTVGNKPQSLALRSESQRVNVQQEGDHCLYYSPDAYLAGQEIDLLRIPANSLAIDALLPGDAVAVGDEYQPPADVLAKLLALAAVQESTVTGEVVSLDPKSARVHFKGRIAGAVSGVPTSIDLVGKLLFDREQKACTWLALALREQREIGKSEPGFAISGTVRMIRKPLDKATRLSDQAVASLQSPVPAQRLLTELVSPNTGFSVLMDRRWKIMSDSQGASMMRMVDADTGIAQANFRTLSKLAAGSQLTLEAFVQECQLSMGDRTVDLLQSQEEVNVAGLRVMRCSFQGLVQEVPVQWVMLQFSDDSGRRLQATFTVSNDHLETFAGSEEQLASALRFTPLPQAAAEVARQPTTAGSRNE